MNPERHHIFNLCNILGTVCTCRLGVLLQYLFVYLCCRWGNNNPRSLRCLSSDKHAAWSAAEKPHRLSLVRRGEDRGGEVALRGGGGGSLGERKKAREKQKRNKQIWPNLVKPFFTPRLVLTLLVLSHEATGAAANHCWSCVLMNV